MWWLDFIKGLLQKQQPQPPKGKWYVLSCKCRICNYTWVGVVEEEEGAEADFGRLECNRCGGRNSEWFDIYGKGELLQ